MRRILLFILLLTDNFLVAQDLPRFVQERIEFCNSNFSEKLETQLQIELNELEKYFIDQGVLVDGSGASYRAVYEGIAKENDLNFTIDKNFEILDTLDFELSTNCFYKLLTKEQLSQLTSRHQKIAEHINSAYDGNISPGVVAQRIIDNLIIEDFNLEFYRISSLLTLYRISHPKSNLDFGLPDWATNSEKDLDTIEIFLNENNEIEINGELSTLEKAKDTIYNFIYKHPQKRGVAFSSSRFALYESYLVVNDMIDSTYTQLKAELGEIPKNIIFKEPK
ncbi:MAG: hypothetical protein ACXIT9_10985 [Nitritalea sp.]